MIRVLVKTVQTAALAAIAVKTAEAVSEAIERAKAK